MKVVQTETNGQNDRPFKLFVSREFYINNITRFAHTTFWRESVCFCMHFLKVCSHSESWLEVWRASYTNNSSSNDRKIVQTKFNLIHEFFPPHYFSAILLAMQQF